MTAQTSTILAYEGEYGKFVVNIDTHEIIEDSLDRDTIWQASGEDYRQQQIIYSEIADALLDSTSEEAAVYAPPQPPHHGEIWGGEEQDFGFRIYLRDGWYLDIEADPQGTCFIEPFEGF